MSNDHTTTEAPKEVKILSPQEQISTDVKVALASTSGSVRVAIIGILTERENEKRKNASISVFEKLQVKTKELTKLEKGGSYSYDADGNKIGSVSFSKQEVEAIKKAREEIKKLENALTSAFDNGDFTKVIELGGKGNPEKTESRGPSCATEPAE